MKNYKVTMVGKSPLLMHADDIEWRDQIESYRKDPLNKKKGKAGDDRSPAWSWVGYSYHDCGVFGIPSDNLMTCIRDGASMVVISGKKTFKSQSQSGILVNEIIWPILVMKNTVPFDPFAKLVGDNSEFEHHKLLAEQYGFTLFVKSAKIGQSKHVRVRPRFDSWSASGTISVFDDMITKTVLENILYMAGNYCGIGDWRPKSPKSPGQFGRFDVTIDEVK